MSGSRPLLNLDYCETKGVVPLGMLTIEFLLLKFSNESVLFSSSILYILSLLFLSFSYFACEYFWRVFWGRKFFSSGSLSLECEYLTVETEKCFLKPGKAKAKIT